MRLHTVCQLISELRWAIWHKTQRTCHHAQRDARRNASQAHDSAVPFGDTEMTSGSKLEYPESVKSSEGLMVASSGKPLLNTCTRKWCEGAEQSQGRHASDS